MTDIRRTVLWVVFATSLLMLWDGWNKYNGRPSLFSPGRPVATAPAVAPANGTLPAPTASAVAGSPATAAVPAAPAASAAAASELVTITTDNFKATVDTRGGDLVRVELLKQAADEDRSRNVVLLERNPPHQYFAQTGLINAAGGALPYHDTVMTARPGERTLKDGANDLQLVLESPEVGGAKLVKTYTFHRGDYAIGVKHEVVNLSKAPIKPMLYLRLAHDDTAVSGSGPFTSAYHGPAVYTEKSKFTKVPFEDIAKGKAEYDASADSGWVAMVQHYFASAWLVNTQQPREFKVEKLAEHLYGVAMVLPLGDVAPDTTKVQEATLYVGPAEEHRLAALAPGLELVRDYGRLTILAKPLFWLLNQLHTYIGNWGWAIVALVVLLKIAFYWLNASAYRSMAKMKAVNPKVQELRERYKDKPQQLQQEMMRIYREEKVNPFGGCLPILVQMPFFIALYSVLLSSVEMRHAPWVGWITDLSAKDPYFILPLVMTGTSLLQTWLSPTPPDPTQAKMMWIMPLVFSVMFFSFPAGLVLYWLTNNILSITQQWLINKQLGVTNK